LRIGINALYLIPGEVGGSEIYLRHLLPALAAIDSVNQYFVFTNRETSADLVPAAKNFTYRPQHVKAKSRPSRIVHENVMLPAEISRLALDIVLNAGFTAPVASPCPQATVFYDLQHKRHPEYFRWFDLPAWRALLWAAVKRSRLIIAISEATAVDLRRYYQLPEAKVRTVNLGVDPRFAEVRERRAPEKFFLTASTLHPHKNLDGLLRAFARFREQRPDFRLTVCGMHGFQTRELLALRTSLGLDGAVDFPGWIPREEVYALYARAWACVFPSRFEGFGLPLLEALSAGIPTACSDVEPTATLAGDAALKFDPANVEAIADAMAAVSGDEALRTRLTEAGPRQAAKYSWEATARGTLQALMEAARRPA
jgi:glycosyltransferase involved in cell wall biosynthesis